MTSINLRKGLEVWYTFDSVDTDSQRNQLRDRSGNGRHADLQGGVTTGVSSPVGEAFSFDGSDDKLEYYGTVPSDDITIFFLIKPRNLDNGNYDRWFNNQQVDIFQQDNENSVNFRLSGPGGSNEDVKRTPIDEGVYSTVIVDYNSFTTIQRVTVDGNTDINSGISGRSATTNHYLQFADDGNGNEAQIDLAAFGIWNRVLSDAEHAQLLNMTDRMVSYL
jgi:hypothetical protein